MNQTNNRFPTTLGTEIMLTFVRKTEKTEVMVQKDRYIRFDWA